MLGTLGKIDLSSKLKIRLSNHPFEFAKEEVLTVIQLDIIILGFSSTIGLVKD